MLGSHGSVGTFSPADILAATLQGHGLRNRAMEASLATHVLPGHQTHTRRVPKMGVIATMRDGGGTVRGENSPRLARMMFGEAKTRETRARTAWRRSMRLKKSNLSCGLESSQAVMEDRSLVRIQPAPPVNLPQPLPARRRIWP